jgi:hypothetical protein
MLKCHPLTPGAAVRRLEARVWRTDGARAVAVAFTLDGDMARIRIPEPRPPRFADDLWKHTCFEIFVRHDGAEAYDEFNFSPSGEWAAYAFERYREGRRSNEDAADPQITVRRTAGGLELDARVQLDESSSGAMLKVGLTAVIEDIDGTLSYWALAHPAGKPDFHHADAFVIQFGDSGVTPRSSRLGSDPAL